MAPAFAENLKAVKEVKHLIGTVQILEATAASKLKCHVYIHIPKKAGDETPFVFVQDGMGELSTTAKALYSGHPIQVKLGTDLGLRILTVDKPGLTAKKEENGFDREVVDKAIFDQHTQADLVDCGAELIEHVVKTSKAPIYFIGFSEGSVIVPQVIVKSKVPAERLRKVMLTSTPILEWKTVLQNGAKLQGKLEALDKMVESGKTSDEFRKEMGMGSKYVQELYKADSGEKAILKLLAAYKKTSVTFYHNSFDPVASPKAIKDLQQKLKKDLPAEQYNLVEFKFFTAFGHTTSDKCDAEILNLLK